MVWLCLKRKSERSLHSTRKALNDMVKVTGSTAITLPLYTATFKLCKRHDPNINACLQTAIQQAIREMKPGLPAFHLLPVDPLHVIKITIEEGAGRPVNMNMEFHNTSNVGLSQGVLTAVRSDLDKRIIEADGIIPESTMEGDYVMDGRFLVLPVKGKGKYKIDFTGLKATLKLQAEPQTKSGKVYWNVVKFELNIKSLENFKVQFDNLFNGDKVL
ncbi:hypothetical protein Cfor_02402, partial [Coptotermes formosanus]